MIEIKEIPPVPAEPTYSISGLSKRDLHAITHLFYYKKHGGEAYADLRKVLSTIGSPAPSSLTISGEW